MRNKIKLFTPSDANQRGDTLISVLLSVAITGLVIVLAYTLVSRSVRYGQQAREREQVKNLIQSQIEGLKSLAAASNDAETHNIFQFDQPIAGSQADEFCLNPLGTIIQLKDAVGPGNIHADIAEDTTDPNKQCDKFSNLEAADVKLSIIYDRNGEGEISDPSDDEHLFTVTATWTRVGGAGDDEKLAVPIRIHPLVNTGP